MTVAVRAGTLIDGTGADPVRGRFVVIEDGVIQSVAKDAPSGAEVIDAGELTILPGLIDCHVHLGMRAEDADPAAVAERPDAVIARDMAEAAARTLRGGITTVRDLGGWNRVDRPKFRHGGSVAWHRLR